MAPKKILILGIPSCLGGNISGCQNGPAAIRKYLIPLLKKARAKFADAGNIEVPAFCAVHNKKEKCLPEIRTLYKNFDKTFSTHGLYQKNVLPVILGGDHSINFQFLKNLSAKRKIGLLWFDAHGDFNTPRITPSGNIHGMVLSALAGHWPHLAGRGLHKIFGLKESKIKEQNICLIGTRDLDPKEKKLLAKTRINIFTMKEIKKRGLAAVLKDATARAGKGTTGFHLSFDLDAIDPKFAPGVGTPVKGGFNLKDLKTITAFMKNQPLTSLDVVELYTTRDKSNKTAKLAAKLIRGLLPS
jgi:arginase